MAPVDRVWIHCTDCRYESSAWDPAVGSVVRMKSFVAYSKSFPL